jgi:hypothetical protein
VHTKASPASFRLLASLLLLLSSSLLLLLWDCCLTSMDSDKRNEALRELGLDELPELPPLMLPPVRPGAPATAAATSADATAAAVSAVLCVSLLVVVFESCSTVSVGAGVVATAGLAACCDAPGALPTMLLWFDPQLPAATETDAAAAAAALAAACSAAAAWCATSLCVSSSAASP